jgi:hypothetical protein
LSKTLHLRRGVGGVNKTSAFDDRVESRHESVSETGAMGPRGRGSEYPRVDSPGCRSFKP